MVLDRYRTTAHLQEVPLNDQWRVLNFIVGTTAVQLDTSALDLRRAILIQILNGIALGGATLYYASHPKVSTTGPDRGVPITELGGPGPGAFTHMNEIGQDLEVWVIADVAGVDVQLMEAS